MRVACEGVLVRVAVGEFGGGGLGGERGREDGGGGSGGEEAGRGEAKLRMKVVFEAAARGAGAAGARGG